MPTSHTELASESAGKSYGHYGHAPGHQYHDVDVVISAKGERFRVHVVESGSRKAVMRSMAAAKSSAGASPFPPPCDSPARLSPSACVAKIWRLREPCGGCRRGGHRGGHRVIRQLVAGPVRAFTVALCFLRDRGLYFCTRFACAVASKFPPHGIIYPADACFWGIMPAIASRRSLRVRSEFRIPARRKRWQKRESQGGKNLARSLRKRFGASKSQDCRRKSPSTTAGQGRPQGGEKSAGGRGWWLIVAAAVADPLAANTPATAANTPPGILADLKRFSKSRVHSNGTSCIPPWPRSMRPAKNMRLSLSHSPGARTVSPLWTCVSARFPALSASSCSSCRGWSAARSRCDSPRSVGACQSCKCHTGHCRRR